MKTTLLALLIGLCTFASAAPVPVSPETVVIVYNLLLPVSV